jgi:histidinol-phosphate aminotransferase
LRAAFAEHRPAVVFIADPNNPTGNRFDPAAIAAVLDAAPGLVVLDEAYLPFAQHTWMPQLAARPRLLVMRTLSKLGLAGIRLGYLCGAPAWIAEFEKLRPPYNVNGLTLAAAGFMLDHLDVLEAQAAVVRAERGRLMQALGALPGVTVSPSAANFVLIRVADAAGTLAGMRDDGVLVKNVSAQHAQLAQCLRLTVGTPAENDSCLAALRRHLT